MVVQSSRRHGVTSYKLPSVPFLADDVDSVVIEPERPVSGDPIELTVTEAEIEAMQSDVVLSFGIADDVDAPAANILVPILDHGRFCPYADVFLPHEEYEAGPARSTPSRWPRT